jgi:hypothetical protein
LFVDYQGVGFGKGKRSKHLFAKTLSINKLQIENFLKIKCFCVLVSRVFVVSLQSTNTNFMVSNVVLRSSDRNLFGVTIKQETKNSFLSVTDLQNAYDSVCVVHGWCDRKISDQMKTDAFRDRVYYILQEQKLIDIDYKSFVKTVKENNMTKTLKDLGVYKTSRANKNVTVSCNPYIWVMFAMELNPMIYAKVVMWLGDTLVFDRIEACDEYKPMNKALKKIIEEPDYRKYAVAINKRVFGKHETGMRNLASSSELKLLTKIEQFITQSIEVGVLTTEEQLMKVINNLYI